MRITRWRVSNWTLGNGNRGTVWRMIMIDRIRAWWHRHICADDATSRRLDALDQELDYADAIRRMREDRRRILHGTCEDYAEQMREGR